MPRSPKHGALCKFVALLRGRLKPAPASSERPPSQRRDEEPRNEEPCEELGDPNATKKNKNGVFRCTISTALHDSVETKEGVEQQQVRLPRPLLNEPPCCDHQIIYINGVQYSCRCATLTPSLAESEVITDPTVPDPKEKTPSDLALASAVAEAESV